LTPLPEGLRNIRPLYNSAIECQYLHYLMEDNKKKIAAMSAVLNYLQTEEEAALYGFPADRITSPAPYGFWSFSGRQSQMMLRSMAQMRLFPAWKG
jgi:hypothetical protein